MVLKLSRSLSYNLIDKINDLDLIVLNMLSFTDRIIASASYLRVICLCFLDAIHADSEYWKYFPCIYLWHVLIYSFGNVINLLMYAKFETSFEHFIEIGYSLTHFLHKGYPIDVWFQVIILPCSLF